MEPNPPFWSGKQVCVTGGCGFLGGHLVNQLLALGAKVRSLGLLPRPDHALLADNRVHHVFGDVRDTQLVRQALTGCDVIFHAAGPVAVSGPALAIMHSVHVDGTRTVLSATAGARVVLTSSIVAVGASTEPTPLTEDSIFNLPRLRVDYVHAKRAAEELAVAAAAAGQNVVLVNPGYLVGPDDHEGSIMGRVCLRFWKGRLPLVPPGGFNFVDVRDVARGHLLAAERGQSGRRYILGGENRSFPEFMRLLAEVGGLSPRALPRAPWWLLGTFAGLAELRAWLKKKEPYPSLQQVRINRLWWFVDSERARRELGYQCRPLVEALADTHRWFAANGEIPLRGLSRWWMRPGASSSRAA